MGPKDSSTVSGRAISMQKPSDPNGSIFAANTAKSEKQRMIDRVLSAFNEAIFDTDRQRALQVIRDAEGARRPGWVCAGS
jgi:N-acetylglutamate synthase/N-acetylornithine aminotransferase